MPQALEEFLSRHKENFEREKSLHKSSEEKAEFSRLFRELETITIRPSMARLLKTVQKFGHSIKQSKPDTVRIHTHDQAGWVIHKYGSPENVKIVLYADAVSKNIIVNYEFTESGNIKSEEDFFLVTDINEDQLEKILIKGLKKIMNEYFLL